MADVASLSEHAATLRRQLHRIPELGYEEHDTAALIREELDRLKIDHVAGPDDAPTATIAVLGDTSKPCILLRADIDALPIVERTGLDYASEREGVMHACGHDGHTANLLGVAAALVDEQLDVCVKLVWQPAEEGGGGGRRLCEAGVLDETSAFGPKVEAAFGLHGWPMLPVGCVSSKPGPLLAATDTFEAVFTGQGGHAAFPHFTRDPLVVAAGAVTDLQQLVSREIDPTDSAVLSVTRFHAGTANNVIPGEAVVGGTCRTLLPETREHARDAMRRRLEAAAAAGRCDVAFTWNDGYPPTVNDPAMTDLVRKVAGQRYLPADRPAMGGEDFSYFLERVPGCFFLIGLLPEGRDDYPALHTDRFDFTDDALAVGIETMLGIVRSYARSSTAA
ncbi:MAG: M20 family metallopeptidase [Planctomycetota bacterium]